MNTFNFNDLQLAKTLRTEGFEAFIEDLESSLNGEGSINYCDLNGYIITFTGGYRSPIRWDSKLLNRANELPVAMKMAEQFANSIEWSYMFHFQE